MHEHEKLLTRARNSQAGWRSPEVEAMLMGFGFLFREGANHRVYYHPRHAELFMPVPRHGQVKSVYVHKAIRLIERLIQLETEHE